MATSAPSNFSARSTLQAQHASPHFQTEDAGRKADWPAITAQRGRTAIQIVQSCNFCPAFMLLGDFFSDRRRSVAAAELNQLEVRRGSVKTSSGRRILFGQPSQAGDAMESTSNRGDSFGSRRDWAGASGHIYVQPLCPQCRPAASTLLWSVRHRCSDCRSAWLEAPQPLAPGVRQTASECTQQTNKHSVGCQSRVHRNFSLSRRHGPRSSRGLQAALHGKGLIWSHPTRCRGQLQIRQEHRQRTGILISATHTSTPLSI